MLSELVRSFAGEIERKTDLPMVGLEEFKKALGDKAKQLPEAEILKLRELQDRIADMVFDNWLRKRNNVVKDDKN